jgi:hypothetical protein
MPSQPSKTLDSFPNPQPERDFTIYIRIPEFTCLCPATGQPDFAELHLQYVPEAACVELKSLKNYIWSYRDPGRLSRGGDQPHPGRSGGGPAAALHAPDRRFQRAWGRVHAGGGGAPGQGMEPERAGQPAPADAFLNRAPPNSANGAQLIRHCIGIDLGTSGVRAEILDAAGTSWLAFAGRGPWAPGTNSPADRMIPKSGGRPWPTCSGRPHGACPTRPWPSPSTVPRRRCSRWMAPATHSGPRCCTTTPGRWPKASICAALRHRPVGPMGRRPRRPNCSGCAAGAG